MSACGRVSPAVRELDTMSSASGSSARTFSARRARMRRAMNSGIWLSPTCAARAITSSSASRSRLEASRSLFTTIPARIAGSAIAPNARMRSTCIR